MRTTVLIPIRSFGDAKRRLAPALDPLSRARLARLMAETVVAAAHDLAVKVVTDDEAVTRWAADLDLATIAVGVEGLNAAMTVAVGKVAAEGIDRVIIAHADLPHARDLRVVTGPGVAIAPDTARDGSNVLSIPTRVGFRFAYGPGSFSAHCAEADRLDLPVRVVDDDSLALDVDDPDDLPVDWTDA